MEILNRVALITGGKRIGQVIAHVLADRGADVVVSYRESKTEADDTVAAVRARGRRSAAIAADVAIEQDITNLVAATVEQMGRLDILINMASVYKPTPFANLTAAEWDRSLHVDLRACFLTSHAAAPHLRQHGGRIINFSDWLAASGRPSYPGFIGYYVAKAGVKALTEGLALELAPDVLVNAIAPGPILPPPDLSDAEKKEVADATPLGHWGGEMAIAQAVVSLVESDFITGETIRVDGGRHVR